MGCVWSHLLSCFYQNCFVYGLVKLWGENVFIRRVLKGPGWYGLCETDLAHWGSSLRWWFVLCVTFYCKRNKKKTLKFIAGCS